MTVLPLFQAVENPRPLILIWHEHCYKVVRLTPSPEAKKGMKLSMFKSMGRLASRIAVGVLLIALNSTSSVAAPTSPEQARSAVNAWRASEKKPMNAVVGSKVLRVVTQNDASGTALYHVVFLTDDGASTKGLVVAAADDEAEPIIAISSGSDFRSRPDDPLKALLDRHVSGVLRKLRNAGPRTAGVKASASAANAKWTRLLAPPKASSARGSAGLGAPAGNDFGRARGSAFAVHLEPNDGKQLHERAACYNYYTPPHAAGSSSNYYCGCVATAIGQVMRFWEYPTTPVGTGTFPIQISGSGTTAALFGGPYQWASMPLSPTGSILPAPAQAIGALIHDVALTADTDFTSVGSSGYMEYAVAALVSTFHYSNAVDVYSARLHLHAECACHHHP